MVFGRDDPPNRELGCARHGSWEGSFRDEPGNFPATTPCGIARDFRATVSLGRRAEFRLIDRARPAFPPVVAVDFVGIGPPQAREIRSIRPEKSLANAGFGRYIWEFHGLLVAGVAQSAEHRFCKPTVVSSTLTASSGWSGWAPGGRWNTGRLGDRHRDGSSETGWIPKWLKGPDCKSGGYAFAGSNPAPPMPREPSRGRPPFKEFNQSDTPTSNPSPAWPFAEPRTCQAPSIATCSGEDLPRGCNSMVEYLPSKQATWVRFPSPALGGLWRSTTRWMTGSPSKGVGTETD